MIGKLIKGFKAFKNDNLKSTRKRPTGSTVPSTPERDMTQMDRREAMAKARQRVEESPIVSGIIQRLADNVVGTGFRLIMTTGNEEFDKTVQDRWNMAKDHLDIRGIRTWGGLCQMWYARRKIDGDVGVNMVDGGEFDGMMKSFLQTMEGDRIYKDLTDSKDTGIDFNAAGRPLRYYIGPRQQIGDPFPAQQDIKAVKSFPARNFILYASYLGHRAERARGVSELLENMNTITDLEQIMDAVLQKVKNESFMGLKFQIAPGPDGSIFGQAESTKNSEDGKRRRHVKLVPGLNVTADKGEEVDVIESKSPNGQFMPFIRFLLRYMGTRWGLPLELMLCDFSDTNYSGGRALIQCAKKRFQVEQHELGAVCSRIFQWWLAREIKHNGLKVPDGVTTAWSHQWGYPGWPYLDPSKEIKAYAEAIANGLTSRQAVLAEVGDMNIEDVAAQLGKEEKLFEEAGATITIGQPGASTAKTTESTDDDNKTEGEDNGAKEE